MIRKTVIAALGILLPLLVVMDASAFELRYLHQAGADINYNLTVTKRNQTTSIDINRHINSNDGHAIDITTTFSNAQISRGGIITLLPDLNGPIMRTVMDDHGMVQSVQALSGFGTTVSSLGLSLQLDLMNSLGVSSFPIGDLSVGGGWTKNATNGATSATFTYLIEQEGQTVGAYNSVVVIDISSGEFDINSSREIVEARQTSFLKGKVAVSGKLYFDIDTGRIVRIDQTLTSHAVSVNVDFNGKAKITPDDSVVTASLVIQ